MRAAHARQEHPDQIDAETSSATTACRDQYRAALRLALDGDAVDQIVADYACCLALGELRTIARAALWRLRLERVRQRLPRRQRAISQTALSNVVAARSQIAYATILGLNLNSDEATAVLATSLDRVADDLSATRSALDSTTLSRCEEQRASLAMYRCGAQSVQQTRLLAHVRACPDCRLALAAAERLDTHCLALIAAQRDSLPSTLPRRRRPVERLLPRVLGIITVAALIGLATLALFTARGIVNLRQSPAPLVAQRASADNPGSLVGLTADGRLQAVNLATGATRILNPEQDATQFSSALASPSGELLAVWQQPSDFDLTWIDITRITGERLRHITQTPNSGPLFPTGWIDDQTLLAVRRPAAVEDESDDSARERIRRESQLVAINVADGDQRVIFQGDVSGAQVSPDGRWMALRADYEPYWFGATIEIRAYDGRQLGAPSVRIEHRAGYGGFWSPDSARFYLAVITDPDIEPFPQGAANGNDAEKYVPFQRMALEGISPTGQVEMLAYADDRNSLHVLAVAPDGRSLLYNQASTDCCGAEGTYWIVPVDGGSPQVVPFATGSNIFGPVIAAPALGGELLTFSRAHYLTRVASGAPPPTEDDGTRFVELQVVLFDGSADLPVVMTRTSDLPVPVGWLAPGGLADPQSAALAGVPSSPQPVTEVGGQTQLTGASRASADGEQIILLDSGRDAPMLWDVLSQKSRPAPSIASDLNWEPNGAGVVSVSDPAGGYANWLIFTPSDDDGMNNLGSQLVDPEGIQNDENQRYASPSLSPLGNRAAYYVLDEQSRVVELHVVDSAVRSLMVARWTTPLNTLFAQPLLTLWADDTTLVYSEPSHWQDGLPNAARLTRVTFAPNGSFTSVVLDTIATRGNERGVEVLELSLSPNGADLAYRVRRYDQLTVDSGRHDSITIAGAANVSGAFELTRGQPGNGLSWSRDSRWLATELGGHLLILASDGHAQHTLGGVADASTPIWLANGEIWFARGAGDTATIWRVVVR